MFQFLLNLLAVRDDEISPSSMGAKHWLWLDNREIKISARLFQYFSVPLVFSLVFSILGIASLISKKTIFGWISLGYFLIVILFFAFVILYNRSVKVSNYKKSAKENNKDSLPENIIDTKLTQELDNETDEEIN